MDPSKLLLALPLQDKSKVVEFLDKNANSKIQLPNDTLTLGRREYAERIYNHGYLPEPLISIGELALLKKNPYHSCNVYVLVNASSGKVYTGEDGLLFLRANNIDDLLTKGKARPPLEILDPYEVRQLRKEMQDTTTEFMEKTFKDSDQPHSQ